MGAVWSAAASQDVKDKPVASELCGEKLVLWRGADGAVHCINDVCPHRGAPLSLGKFAFKLLCCEIGVQ